MSRRTPPSRSELTLEPLGEAIRRARERLGWSQNQLALVMDLNVGTVSRWERAKAIPEATQAALLERVLGLEFVPAARVEELSPARLNELERVVAERSDELLGGARGALKAGGAGLPAPRRGNRKPASAGR